MGSQMRVGLEVGRESGQRGLHVSRDVAAHGSSHDRRAPENSDQIDVVYPGR